MRERDLLTASALGLFLIGMVAVATSAPGESPKLRSKPAPPAPAVVTFQNTATTMGVAPRITGDGGLQTSTYRTENGVTCQIFTGGSEDLTLNLNLSRSRPKRYLTFDYSDPADSSLQPTLNPPTGSLSDVAFMNIAAIGRLAIGSSATRTAYFSTAVGMFEANPDRYAEAQLVSVTRHTVTTWTVTTDNAGAAPDVGDLLVFYQTLSKALVPVGLYHMPFELTVSCPTCR